MGVAGISLQSQFIFHFLPSLQLQHVIRYQLEGENDVHFVCFLLINLPVCTLGYIHAFVQTSPAPYLDVPGPRPPPNPHTPAVNKESSCSWLYRVM